jgi:hypothetical protein
VGEQLDEVGRSPCVAGVEAGDDLGHVGCGQDGGWNTQIRSFGRSGPVVV